MRRRRQTAWWRPRPMRCSWPEREQVGGQLQEQLQQQARAKDRRRRCRCRCRVLWLLLRGQPRRSALAQARLTPGELERVPAQPPVVRLMHSRRRLLSPWHQPAAVPAAEPICSSSLRRPQNLRCCHQPVSIQFLPLAQPFRRRQLLQRRAALRQPPRQPFERQQLLGRLSRQLQPLPLPVALQQPLLPPSSQPLLRQRPSWQQQPPAQPFRRRQLLQRRAALRQPPR